MTDQTPPAVVKIAGWVPVSTQLLDDFAPVQQAIDEALDRYLNPWKYPDRRGWPKQFVLVPWLARLTAWWERRRSTDPDVWVEEW